MAKPTQPASAWQAKDIVKLRRFVYMRELRGQVITQSWPRPRGKVKSPYQQAWVDWFSAAARASKTPLEGDLDWMQSLVKKTGWYYRDLYERAMAGKVMVYGAQKKVGVPTAQVYRATAQALTAGVWTDITFSNVSWDTNLFVHSGDNIHLHIKTPGLYLVQSQVNWPTTGGGSYRGHNIQLDDAFTNYVSVKQPFGGLSISDNLTALMYLVEGQKLGVKMVAGEGSQTGRLIALSVVGITPESISA